jgi:hypothetical protein
MAFKFFSSEQHERSKKFDELRHGMLRLIDESPVDEPVLKDYREDIRSTIAQAFLPDLRHGEVHLPKSQQYESNIPLLPVHTPTSKRSGERLFLSGELIAATPQRRRKLCLLGDVAIAPTMRCIQTEELFRKGDSDGMVHSVSQPLWVSTTRGARVAGRPIVMSSMNSRTPKVDHYLALEGMVHAADSEQWNPNGHASPAEWRTWKAATRLHAGAIVVACCMPMILQIPLKASSLDQDVACWSMWKEYGFSHDTMPDLPSDVIQKIGLLGLLEG